MENDIVKQQPKNNEEPVFAQKEPEQQPPAQHAKAAVPAKPSEPAPIPGKEQPKPVPAAPKSTKPVGVILAAVVVCLVLIGAAVYGGMQHTGEISSPKPAPAATQPDETSQSIDEAIKDTESLPDSSQDMNPDLSNEALGL